MERSSDRSPMQKKSSSFVRVFYPRFNREELLTLLRRRVKSLQAILPVRRVVLFGSYTQGRQTAGSDIDLLVVYAGPRREDAYALVRRTLQIPRLEAHVLTENEYESVKDTWKRMLQHSIPVITG